MTTIGRRSRPANVRLLSCSRRSTCRRPARSADLHFLPFLMTVRDSEVVAYKPRAYRSRAITFLEEGNDDGYRDYLMLAA